MGKKPCALILLASFLLIPQASWGAQNLLEGDSSFETGHGVWSKVGSMDETTAFEGQRSVRLTGGMATWQRFKLAPGKLYTFSLYLKAKAPGTKVLLQAARTNWSGDESSLVVVVGAEWKRYSLSIRPKPDSSPTVWLRVSRPEWLGQPDRTYWLDACQLEEGEMTAYQSAEPVSLAGNVESPVEGNILFPEEKVKIQFNLYNSRNEAGAVNLSYRIKDYYETVVESATIPLDVPPKRNLSQEVALGALKKKGFYLVEYGLADQKEVLSEKRASFCVVARPLPYSTEEGTLFAAASVEGGRVPAAARIGVKWTEARFNWRDMENEKGKIDLAYAERRVDQLRQHNVNAIGRFCRTPQWASEYWPAPGDSGLPKLEALPAYENFAHQVVNHLKDRVHYWMHWGGEDDLTVKSHAARMGKSEDWVIERLAELMKAGYRGAKRADPGCVYGGTGQPSGVDCGIHFPFTKKLLALAGDHTDFLGLDCYTWPRYFKEGWKVESPEQHRLTDILREALSLAGDRKCWIAEYGFGLSLKETMESRSARMMADYMARSYILTATVPRIEMLQWFSFWDTVEGESSYDMWRWPNPLPVVAAYSALAQVLTGARNPREIEMGSAIKAYAFEKRKGSLAALWVPSNREIAIELNKAMDIRTVDIMGNEIGEGVASLKLSGSPMYLLSDMTAEALANLVSQARIGLKPVTVELQVADVETMRVHLANQTNAMLSGEILLSLPVKDKGAARATAQFSQLRPGAAQAVSMTVPGRLDLTELRDFLVAGEVKTEKGEVKVSQRLSLNLCPRVDRRIVIDGDLKEWEGRPFIELKDATYLAPPDALSHNLWTGPADLSVRVYLGWDDQHFYFAAHVRDDVAINEAEKETIWSGDSIQIAFDPNNDAVSAVPGYGAEDKEFSFGYSHKLNAPAIYRHWPLPPAEPKAELAIKREGDYTAYELALPFKQLSPLKPEAGKVFGFSFVVLDRDQGRKVDYWLGLTPGICGGKDPAAFRKFVLVQEQEK